jgi:hypothetical protein
MEDFEMMCETIARKIFQCGRFDDPLGRLANTDSWSGLFDEKFSKRHLCKAWAVIARLQNEYLDSIIGREELYALSEQLEEKLINATVNQDIIDVMESINKIVKQININEFPHISYSKTNE